MSNKRRKPLVQKHPGLVPNHAAVTKVLLLMDELGVGLFDLDPDLAERMPRRRIQYRDKNGNTWTGVGQRPKWLRDALLAGATVEDFKVPS